MDSALVYLFFFGFAFLLPLLLGITLFRGSETIMDGKILPLYDNGTGLPKTLTFVCVWTAVFLSLIYTYFRLKRYVRHTIYLDDYSIGFKSFNLLGQSKREVFALANIHLEHHSDYENADMDVIIWFEKTRLFALSRNPYWDVKKDFYLLDDLVQALKDRNVPYKYVDKVEELRRSRER
jgi:hypothetical protein